MEMLQLDIQKEHTQQLVTVAIGKICSAPSCDVAGLHAFFERFTRESSGELIHFGNNIFITTFKGPSKAVDYGLHLRESLRQYEAELAIGIHIRECNSSSSINSQTIDIVKSMLDKVEPNHVLITEIVRQLLPVEDLSFASYKSIFDPISNELLQLYKVSQQEVELTVSHQRVGTSGHSLLDMIIGVIDSNLSSESFKVEEICKEVGISERQLQRKIKLLTRKSPGQFVTSIRLSRAKEMLKARNCSVSEIAFRTGFSNPSYFAKCFKKEFGTNPSAIAV